VIFEQLMANPGTLKLAGLAVGDPCLGLDVFCGPGLFKVMLRVECLRLRGWAMTFLLAKSQRAAAHCPAGPLPRTRFHVKSLPSFPAS
jgi:hypothetical protein